MSIKFVDKTLSKKAELAEADLVDTYEFTGSIGTLLVQHNIPTNSSDTFIIDTACDSGRIMTLMEAVNAGEDEEKGPLTDELFRRQKIKEITDIKVEGGITVEERPEIGMIDGPHMTLANIIFKCSDGKLVSAEYCTKLMGAQKPGATRCLIRFFKNTKAIENNDYGGN